MSASDTLPTYSEFSDPRLAALYDTFNALGQDSQFFQGLVKRFQPDSLIDFGCGTGLLTCELARLGYVITGIDPASEMLKLAQLKSDSQNVTWIHGSTEQLTGLKTDLILMTSHVAQFFLKDADWLSFLKAARQTLQPDGRLIFDSRHPLSQPWQSWTHQQSARIAQTEFGEVECWYQLLEAHSNQVRYQIHYHFKETEQKLISLNQLIYRSQSTLRQDLTESGFVIEALYGNWDGSLFSEQSPEMIFVCRAV